MLADPFVRRDLSEATRVFCKLDATNDQTLSRINRPAPGATLEKIVRGIGQFRQEYTGHLAIQVMLMKSNLGYIDEFAGLLSTIRPDEVQLNTPLRPVPMTWRRESRGELCAVESPGVFPRPISRGEAASAEQRLQELTGLKISSVYQREVRS